MDARTEGFEEFYDFINFLVDDSYELQSDFSNTDFDLQRQDELFCNVPNTIENQTFENQSVSDQALNNNALHEQAKMAMFPSPINPTYPPASLDKYISKHSKVRRHRLTKFQKSCLNNWLVAHQSWPYPNADEFSALAGETFLTEKQVRTWFNNARSRQGTRAVEASDPAFPRTANQNIPMPHTFEATETPFQRWRNSPPEDEASLEAIKHTSIYMRHHGSMGYSDPDSGMVSEEVLGRDSVASSTASGSCSSRISVRSSLSLASYDARRKRKGRRRSYNYGPRNIVRKRSRGLSPPGYIIKGLDDDVTSNPQASELALTSAEIDEGNCPLNNAISLPKPARFDCTFCLASFPYKYTWERHETSVHRPQEQWICMAAGPTIISDLGSACVFCNLSDPTHDHLANDHNYAPCLQRRLPERTFERKDGLQQHLTWVHNQNSITPYMLEHWSSNIVYGPQEWTCGICGKDFIDWKTRLKHIGDHWDEGLNMDYWRNFRLLREIKVDTSAAPSFGAYEQSLPKTSHLEQHPQDEGYSRHGTDSMVKQALSRQGTATQTTVRPVSRIANTFSLRGFFGLINRNQN